MLFEYAKDPVMINMPLAEIFQLEACLFDDIDILEQLLSVRTKNCCKRNHIDTVGNLLSQTPGSLIGMRSFGKGCLDEVERFVKTLRIPTTAKALVKEDAKEIENEEQETKRGYWDAIKDETCRDMVLQAMKAYYALYLNKITECLKTKNNASTKYISITTGIPQNTLNPLMEVLEEMGVVEHLKTTASKYYNLIEEDPTTFVAGHGALETMDW